MLIEAVGPSDAKVIILSDEPLAVGSGWRGVVLTTWGQWPASSRSHRLHRLRFGTQDRWRGCPRLVGSLCLSD